MPSGGYTDGTSDFASIIAKFKAANVDILHAAPITPDFITFWRQAHQNGFTPKIDWTQPMGLNYAVFEIADLVIVGGLAVAATLVSSRGLWGFAAERFGWSLLPVGYRVRPPRG